MSQHLCSHSIQLAILCMTRILSSAEMCPDRKRFGWWTQWLARSNQDLQNHTCLDHKETGRNRYHTESARRKPLSSRSDLVMRPSRMIGRYLVDRFLWGRPFDWLSCSIARNIQQMHRCTMTVRYLADRFLGSRPFGSPNRWMEHNILHLRRGMRSALCLADRCQWCTRPLRSLPWC